MSIVSFQCELQTDELNRLQFPVEIRRPSLGLEAVGLTHDPIDLKPGVYHVKVQLPSGQQIWDTVQIEGPGNFVLRPESPAPFAWIAHRHFLYHDVLSGGDLAAAGPEDLVALQWFRSSVGDAEWTKTADAPMVPHAFTAIPVRPEGESRCLVRMEQSGAPALCLALPIGPEGGCTISFPRTTQRTWLVDVRLDHAMGDLLLRYLARGMRDEAAALLHSRQLGLDELVGKSRQPIAAVVVAYARLQFGSAEDIHGLIDGTGSLMRATPWMADSAIVHAEALGRLGRHADSYSALIESARRGPPIFKKGLDYAVARLGLYTGRISEGRADRQLAEAQRSLAALQKLAMPSRGYSGGVVTVPPGMEELYLVREAPQFSTDQERSIGIHLGRRLATIAAMNGVEAVVLPDQEGAFATPAVIAPDESGEWVAGRAAEGGRQRIAAGNGLFERSEDAREELEVSGRTVSRAGAWTVLLRSLRELAETYCGQTEMRAVIAVPVESTPEARRAMREAGEQAGFQVPFLIYEAEAAALAYGLDRDERRVVVVYELRKRNFNVSVHAVSSRSVKTMAVYSEPTLGGDEIDRRILDHLRGERGPDLARYEEAAGPEAVRKAVERARIQLSELSEVELELPGKGASPSIRIQREIIEPIIEKVIDLTLFDCEEALTKAGIEMDQVNDVLLLGGVTRMPQVREKVETFFGKRPLAFQASYHFAIGAAIAAANAGALQSGVLPLSIGIETLGGLFTVMIERNTKLPAKKTEVFSTAQDNQASVEVKVLQGERAMAKDNSPLGVFQLGGIPPAPRGVPQIEVSFEVDEAGRLTVSAKDRSRNEEQRLTVQETSGLRRAAVEGAIEAAEANAEGDRRARELVDTRNRVDTTIGNIERMLKEHPGKVGSEAEQAIARAIQAAKEAIGGEDMGALRAAEERLTATSLKLTEAVYSGAAAEAKGEWETAREGRTVNEREYADLEEEG